MAKISKDTIDRLCRLTGKKSGEISLELGRSQSYLGHFKNGSLTDMRRGDILAIQQLYGIDLEELEKEASKPNEEKDGNALDTKKLYRTIYSAVFNAVKAAWEDAPTIAGTAEMDEAAAAANSRDF